MIQQPQNYFLVILLLRDEEVWCFSQPSPTRPFFGILGSPLYFSPITFPFKDEAMLQRIIVPLSYISFIPATNQEGGKDKLWWKIRGERVSESAGNYKQWNSSRTHRESREKDFNSFSSRLWNYKATVKSMVQNISLTIYDIFNSDSCT